MILFIAIVNSDDVGDGRSGDEMKTNVAKHQ